MECLQCVYLRYTQSTPSDELRMELVYDSSLPHVSDVRDGVLRLLDEGETTPKQIAEINYQLGESFAHAVLTFCHINQIDLANEVDLISSHGQRIWHLSLPELFHIDNTMRSNLDMAEMAIIAARTGKTTVTNFCVGEQAYGRQGAPLFGFMKALMLVHPARTRAAQSINDIATVCFVPADDVEGCYEFDIGPGVLLINAAVRFLTDGDHDNDDQGILGRNGIVDQGIVDEFLHQPYFAHSLPKSCGIENFDSAAAYELCERMMDEGMSTEDCVATLTRITAQAIVEQYAWYGPPRIDEMFLCGTGSENPNIINYLQERMPTVQLRRFEEIGIPGGATEAICVGQLGLDCLLGRPGIVPQRVETRAPAVIGQIQPGRNWRGLTEQVAHFWEGEDLDTSADCVTTLRVVA